jgi:hypothetical protein
MSGQKLADGNYICRKVCGKQCFKLARLAAFPFGAKVD